MKFQKQPGNLLRHIAEASIKANSERPVNQDLQNCWSGIGFSLCGQKMVAPMGQVIEILNVPNYTFVPGVQDWMLGLANVRGRLLPLIDLERYFGSRLAGNKSRHRVLIIDVNNHYAGLVVSNVFGLKHFQLDAFEKSYDGAGELFASCIEAKGSDGDSEWLKFQPDRLAQDSRFMDSSISASDDLNKIAVA